MSAKAEIVPMEQPDKISPMSLLQLAVDRGANIDTIERLAKLQREMLEYDNKMAFAEAMQRAQEAMGRVRTDAENSQTRSRYATYAALDRAVRPIYSREGFSLSFGTIDCPLADHVRVCCTLTHRAGHSKEFQIDMPNDGKGAKGGDVMTKTHATGAAASYGMRYLLKMIWNIAVGEDDKDGNEQDDGPHMEDALVVERIEWIKGAERSDDLLNLFNEAVASAKECGDKSAIVSFTNAMVQKALEWIAGSVNAPTLQVVFQRAHAMAESVGDKNAALQLIKAKDAKRKQLQAGVR